MTHPFTDTYIQMAKAAEEIQAMRPDLEDYQLGDWFQGDQGPELYDRCTGYMGETPAFLPRLDQLLGMLGEPEKFIVKAADSTTTDDIVVNWEYRDIKDWHQLAIIMVMREKYGKVWRGGAWVKA